MSRTDNTVAYCAPGSGLGHLTRGCAVSLHLDELGVRCRVFTNSRFAPALARLTGCDIRYVPTARWEAEAVSAVEAYGPRLIVLDTFPWGMRGEWLERTVADARFVYLARRLKVQAYLGAIGATWAWASPHVARVLVCEPLSADHLSLVEKGAADVVGLQGRIRFPSDRIPLPVPEELLELCRRKRVWLVVHSGPVHEVRELVAVAERASSDDANAAVALVTARAVAGLPYPRFEYFPASRLFGHVHRIVTAAGYNAIAEGTVHQDRQDRHMAVPFERTYDDQHARAAETRQLLDDGSGEAAATVARWLA